MRRGHLKTRFLKEDQGSMTVFGLYLFIGIMMIGALAVDVASAYMARTQLQVAADATAHAALYLREDNSSADSKAMALNLTSVNMPSSKFGTVLSTSDMHFGYWDRDTQMFTVDETSKDGVMVDLARLESNGNPVGTFLLRLVGVESFNMRRQAVFETFIPTCYREGLVAENIVDMQSNNVFTSGFCIHANDHVEMNNSNVFQNNTVVSMPDQTAVVIPSNDPTSNPGIDTALHDGSYRLRIINDLPNIINDLYVGDFSNLYQGVVSAPPPYITNTTPIELFNKNVTMADFTPGRIHTMSCVGNQSVRFLATNFFSEFVFVTNCKINFGALTTFENTIIATTHTGAESMLSAAELQVGRNDNCAPGGGSQFLTLGGMNYPALLEVYGGQFIAVGVIEFTANANGIQGASFISGDTVSGTSNMVMGFCGGAGMENLFGRKYFRLAA